MESPNVNIFIINTSENFYNFNKELRKLDPEQSKIVNQYVKIQDKKNKCASQNLQLYMLRKLHNIIDPIIIKNKYGKPICKNDKTIDFNISHDGYLVVGLSNTLGFRNGIDILHINRKDKINIYNFKYIFTEFEWKQIIDYIDPRTMLIYFWCLKESYIKCVGKGLNIQLNTLEINFNNFKPFLTDPKKKNFIFKLFYPHEEFIGSICLNYQSTFTYNITYL